MHPQLQAIANEFDSATARLDRLAAQVSEADWVMRPEAGRWSVAECVQHLSLTARGYESAVDQALAEARAIGGLPPTRYRRDLAGWLLWKMVSPVPSFRMPTTPPFTPASATPRDAVLGEFARWQAAQRSWVTQSDGLPIDRVKVASPFNPKLRYSFYAALTILPRHQHRHLCQAEGAWQALQALRPA